MNILTHEELELLSDEELDKYIEYFSNAGVNYDVNQKSYKEINNSIYGVTGNGFFRFYDIRIAEGITLSGQTMIGWIIKDVNMILNKWTGIEKDRIVASDTDSIYVDLEDIVNRKFPNGYESEDVVLEFLADFCDNTMNSFIEKSISNLAKYLNALEPGALDMKRETIADSVIFVAKKHYIMSIRDEEGAKYERYKNVAIKGLEAIKGATPKFCQEKLKEIYNTLLFDKEEVFFDKLKEVKQEFRNLSPDDIAENSGVNTIYKSTDSDGRPKKGAHITVRAASAYNLALKELGLESKYPSIRDGDKMKYVKLKTPNKLKTKTMAWLGDFPEEFSHVRPLIDYDDQIDKFLTKPSWRVAEACGYRPMNSADPMPFL